LVLLALHLLVAHHHGLREICMVYAKFLNQAGELIQGQEQREYRGNPAYDLE
jgi:hypothetical protein